RSAPRRVARRGAEPAAAPRRRAQCRSPRRSGPRPRARSRRDGRYKDEWSYVVRDASTVATGLSAISSRLSGCRPPRAESREPKLRAKAAVLLPLAMPPSESQKEKARDLWSRGPVLDPL